MRVDPNKSPIDKLLIKTNWQDNAPGGWVISLAHALRLITLDGVSIKSCAVLDSSCEKLIYAFGTPVRA